MIEIAVVGAHLSGQPLNHQLVERGARLVRPARSAMGYSLYVLNGTVPARPGLVFDGVGAGAVEVEVWSVPLTSMGSFLTDVASPLGIGTIRLDDGSSVKGFICEAHAVAQATDITHFGGWRAYLKAVDELSR